MCAQPATIPSSGRDAAPEPASLASQLDELRGSVQQESASAAVELESVLTSAASGGHVRIAAEAAYLAARARVNLGHLEVALDHIDRARTLWLETGDVLQALRTDLGRMHVLDDLGRHIDAVATGHELLDRLGRVAAGTDPDVERWLSAAALENIGVSNGYIGNHRAALEAYSRAEAVHRELGSAEDAARPMGNRGVELLALGRPADALDAFDAATAVFVDVDDPLHAAMFTAYAASAHVAMGDHLRAAAALQRASDLLVGQEATTEYARTQLVRGRALTTLNLLDEAHDLYGDLAEGLADAGLRHDLAEARHGLGVVALRRGHRQRAQVALTQAIDLYDEVGGPVASAASRLALSEAVDLASARALVAEVIDDLDGAARPDLQARALVRAAQLAPDDELRGRRLDQAAEALGQRALPGVEWRLLHERGRWLGDTGHHEDAMAALEGALAVIEDVRATVAATHDLQSFMGRRDLVLHDLVRMELRQGQVEAALARVEASRARTLTEALRGDIVGVDAVPSGPELDAIYDRLLRAPITAATELRRDARAIERQVRPRLVRQAPRTPGGVTADHPLAITYDVLGEEVLAFVQAGDEVAVARRLGTTGDVEGLLRELDGLWRRMADPALAARHGAHLLRIAVDVLQRLYLQLIAPLPGLPNDDGDVLVVPYGVLANVPFAALHDGTGHLVERWTTTTAPSRTVAAHARDGARGRWDRRLAIGVRRPELPTVQEELDAVAASAQEATVLFDDRATIDALRAEVHRHDVVHIACHGVHRPDSPEFSALRLDDGWLTGAQISGLELAGQVVVLSACSSGRQRAIGTGDELVGLPRAFMAAGASSVIVNLWPVDDRSASRLMGRFHHHLGDHGPVRALAAAQCERMAEAPHPFHWAPAVAFGAPDPPTHTRGTA